MEKIIDALSAAGFSKLEANIYAIVLTDGPVSVTKIARLASAYRANTYQALERLKSKGFVSEVHGKKSREFVAMSPTRILESFEKRKKEIEDIIPELNRMRSTSIGTTSMRVIEGASGWKHLLYEFAEMGVERVVFGVPKESIQFRDFYEGYHKAREKKKLWLRRIFNYDARERIKHKPPYTENKYLPKELDQPVSTSVCGNIVALTVYKGKNVSTVIIENALIADAYRTYFEYLWKHAKS